MAAATVKTLYAEIAALTLAACQRCPEPLSCCEAQPHGCQLAATHMERTEGAAEHGAEHHPTLRYMGPKGCILAPHRRPACATWCCAMRDPLRRRANPELRREYARLRAAIDASERGLPA